MRVIRLEKSLRPADDKIECRVERAIAPQHLKIDIMQELKLILTQDDFRAQFIKQVFPVLDNGLPNCPCRQPTAGRQR